MYSDDKLEETLSDDGPLSTGSTNARDCEHAKRYTRLAIPTRGPLKGPCRTWIAAQASLAGGRKRRAQFKQASTITDFLECLPEK